MAKESSIDVDEKQFMICMEEQKQRSKTTSEFKVVDESIEWTIVNKDLESEFIGYESEISNTKIIKYRKLDKNQFEIVIHETPFYAESGGQIGDTGYFESDNFIFRVLDTQKRNDDICYS